MKAHIIPKSVYKPYGDQKAPPLLLKEKDFPKRSRTGVYDEKIVCQDCEQLFLRWDDYGCKFLQAPPSAHRIEHDSGGRDIAYVVDPVNYDYLRLFVLSVLWRASVSTQEFFHKVNLGPLEDRLRTMILSADPGGLDDFGMIFLRYVSPPGGGFPCPYRGELQGRDGVPVKTVKLTMGNMQIEVIVDEERGCPRELHSLLLAPGRELIVFLQRIEESTTLGHMQEIMKRSRKR